MIDERKEGDPLQGARVMLMGTAAATDDPEARRRYHHAHPSAEAFVDFKDFSLFRIVPSGLHLVAGFGRIIDLSPAQFLIRTSKTGRWHEMRKKLLPGASSWPAT